LRRGDFVRIMPEYGLQHMNLYALYASRQYLDAKIKTWVECLRRLIPEFLAADAAALAEFSGAVRIS